VIGLCSIFGFGEPTPQVVASRTRTSSIFLFGAASQRDKENKIPVQIPKFGTADSADFTDFENVTGR
jgi:hypothetical protein